MRSTLDSPRKISPTTCTRHVFNILSLSSENVCNPLFHGLGVVCMQHGAGARGMFEGLGWETHVVRGVDEGGGDLWWLGRCLLAAGLGAWLLPASVGTRVGLAGSALWWLSRRFRKSAAMMVAHRPWLLEAEGDRAVRLTGSVWSLRDWLTPSFAQIVSYRHIASGVRFVMVHLSLARRGAVDLVDQAMEHAEEMATMVTLSGTLATLPIIITGHQGSDTNTYDGTAIPDGFDATSSVRVTRRIQTAGGIESTVSLTLSPW